MSASNNTVRTIPCSVGKETFFLETKWVENIARSEAVQWNEQAEGPQGWIPNGKSATPVFRLARLLEWPAVAGPFERAILLKTAGVSWGLLVDQVSQVVEISSAQFLRLPELLGETAKRLFAGVVATEQSLALLLAPETLHPDHTSEGRTTAARTESVSSGHAAAAKSSQRNGNLVVCNLGNSSLGNGHRLAFGLSTTQVLEILTPPRLTPVPGAAHYLRGLLRWRNRVVPVLDLSARLGLPRRESTQQARLMVIAGTREDAPVGLLVPQDIRMLKLPASHQPYSRKLPIPSSFVKGAVELEKEILLIPNLRSLLSPACESDDPHPAPPGFPRNPSLAAAALA